MNTNIEESFVPETMNASESTAMVKDIALLKGFLNAISARPGTSMGP